MKKYLIHIPFSCNYGKLLSTVFSIKDSLKIEDYDISLSYGPKSEFNKIKDLLLDDNIVYLEEKTDCLARLLNSGMNYSYNNSYENLFIMSEKNTLNSGWNIPYDNMIYDLGYDAVCSCVYYLDRNKITKIRSYKEKFNTISFDGLMINKGCLMGLGFLDENSENFLSSFLKKLKNSKFNLGWNYKLKNKSKKSFIVDDYKRFNLTDLSQEKIKF